MKNIKKIWIFVLILLCNTFAQQYLPEANLTISSKNVLNTSLNNVKILAVMVEFQEDTDGATFGNGKFGSIYKKNYGNKIIDPLPHDKLYFENHLLFSKNYFSKVSEGKVTVDYTVLPNVITVSKKMREYSPLPKSNDFTNLGDFSKEVWQEVVTQNPNMDFSQFGLFVIFHAGVGRDVNLPGSLGNERDLPSVYLSQNQLKKIYGADFNGFPANNSLITNTVILPETESREISSVTGDVLLELSINGLIVSSIASHLGLPDLFDTNTGLSAIGRFGLMDGQAIFAYSGLFPPEPSAWEKIFLGWETPIVIENSGVYNLQSVAKIASTFGDAKIYKIPINNYEYFLVENRQRDVNNDGIILTIFDNGSIITKSFPKDTTGFSIGGVDTLQGVIIDVDEYDWAVPGSGIVIWHIDESVINSKIAENKINTDKFHRGVDVEEADGIQDIGEEFTTVFGDIVVGEGEAVDMWYLGNKSKLYKNRFTFDTKPNSLSYSGANSLVTISDFSDISNRMSFRVTIGSDRISYNVTNLLSDNYSYNLKVDDDYYLVKQRDLYKISNNNETLIANNFTNENLRPAFTLNTIAGCFNNIVNTYDVKNNLLLTVNLPENITSSPVITENGDVLIGTENGKIIKVTNSNFYYVNYSNELPHPIRQISRDITPLLYDTIGILDQSDYSLNQGEKYIKYLIGQGQINPPKNIVLTNFNRLFLVNEKGIIQIAPNSKIEDFCIVPLLNNGLFQIIFTEKNKVWAYNISGSVCDGFPIILDDDVTLEPFVQAINYDEDKTPDILVYDKKGLIYLFSGLNKKLISGFPFSTGSQIACIPYVNIDSLSGTKYYSISAISGNKLYTYSLYPNINNMGLEFVGYYGKHSNDSRLLKQDNYEHQQEFFPEERAYNWPNPVYGNSTFIRYYVKNSSNVNIKIFDLAGSLVDEINTYGFGGSDNEVEWDVSEVQSGVYFARIEANEGSSNSGLKIIKIAVIK
ncbi:MAG TPA: T9SS type A sorting domain-containing protein [Melioribacteraceae bacterium]|nr:T9SS type A sorting domain-containing protein [Melioribacteraceae bacterium]